MLKLYDKGVYLLNGTEIVEEKEAVAAKTGKDVTPRIVNYKGGDIVLCA